VVVTLVRVRVTKVIVTRLKELEESLQVAKPREIYAGPCGIIRGVLLRIGGSWWGGDKVKSRP
jgi:hypothetical protein